MAKTNMTPEEICAECESPRRAGPRMSDPDFFAAVDNTLPGLEAVGQAAEKGDYAAARHLFAAYIREDLKPDRFFTIPYEKGENAYTYPGETEQEAAGRVITHQLISCGTPCQFGDTVDWFCNPTFNQYKEWTWQLSRHNEWKTLAAVYRETQDEKYAEGFVDLFESWVRQALVPLPVDGHLTRCWRTIEAGIRMGANWPYVLHSFYRSPAFTDDVLIDWYKSVWEHGWRLSHFSTSANWLIMEMNGLAQIGILYPVFKDSAAWLKQGFDELERQLDLQVYPDGFQYELSTNYHEVFVNNYFRLIYTAKAYGIEIPATFLSKLENALSFYTKLPMPDLRLPDLNDGRWASVSRYLSLRLDIYPHRKDFLWFTTKGAEGEPPAFTSIALPWSGFMVMRTGWDKNAVWALLDAAPFGRGHQHEDKLNLLLYACGKLLLTEGGNYAYDSSGIRDYALSTRSHNTARVDQQCQNRRKGYSWNDTDIQKKADLRYQITDQWDMAVSQYTEGYGPDAAPYAEHERFVCFIKTGCRGAKPFFIVVDRFRSKDGQEHDYELLWHPAEPSVTMRQTTADTDHLRIIAGGPESLSMQVTVGQEQPEYQGWKINSSIQGDYIPAPAVSCHAHGKGLRIVTLLCPHEGDCGISSVFASGSLDDHDITIQLEDGFKMQLNENTFLHKD